MQNLLHLTGPDSQVKFLLFKSHVRDLLSKHETKAFYIKLTILNGNK